MPRDNNFLHAKYARSDPGERVKYLTLETGDVPHSLSWKAMLGQTGETLCQAGVRMILLVYGSYYGSDLFGTGRLDELGGLRRGYSRGIPGLESLLATIRPAEYQAVPQDSSFVPPFFNNDSTKLKLDGYAGEVANFTDEYLQGLQDGLSKSNSMSLTCSRYLWSSLHHHLGRIEAALSLFNEIVNLKKQLGVGSHDRILILAHGHAGQVMALLSNLIATQESTVRSTIFEILASYYGQAEELSQTATYLKDLDQFIAEGKWDLLPVLDVVTLGTPIRYGWDTSGIGKLLHVVNHRPIRSDNKKWLAKMDLPQIVMEISMAAGGDYVQQLAVAGTDAVPTTPFEQEFNQALQENLEPYNGFERWLECARRVTRCPGDGQCLLIDYQNTVGALPREHLFGHACYTYLSNLLFQTTHIVNTLYV